jgi:L-amino acid N-acyltransferase YncA
MKQQTAISKNAYTFRLAQKEEAAEVLDLYRAAAATGDTEWDEEYPNAQTIEMDLAAGGLYVLCQGARIVGAVSRIDWPDLDAMPLWSPCKRPAGLARLCVHPVARGQGLGRVLVEEIRRVVKEQGFDMTHHMASQYMEAPLRIYRSMGFRQVGEIHMFDTDYFGFELEL